MAGLILVALLAGCGPGTDSAGPSPLDWSFAFEVEVSEYRSPGGGDAMAWATVTNRESEAPPWELEEGAGECGFYGVRPLQNCDPACETGTVCTWDGECVEPTVPIDAGTITVAGLEVGLELTSSGDYVYYGYDFEPEPEDGEIFGEGDPITVQAAGADLGAFELETLGVAPLDSDMPCPLDAEDSDDLTLRWTPGQAGDTLRLELASTNHGSMFPAIVCEAEDDGELILEGGLLERWWDSALPGRSRGATCRRVGGGEVDGVAVRATARGVEGCSW